MPRRLWRRLTRETRSTQPTARHYPAAMSTATFRHEHRVTYADCTAGNHVYYARYLALLEAGRNEFVRGLGQPFLGLQDQEVIFPVVECHVRYKSPARYDDLLTIEVWPTLAERARLNFAYRIVNASGSLILEAETCHVCAGANDKPRRLPEAFRLTVLPHIRSAAN